MNPSTMTFHANGSPIAKSAEYSTYVVVHEDHCGLVIGKAGRTVQHIALQTNTWIRIQPANEWSFGHPWFIIKGRDEDDVATARHYIINISKEAERRHPTMDVFVKPQLEALTDEDLDNIDEFYDTLDDTFENLHLWEEYIIANEIETDRVSTFNAALTDFERKIYDSEMLHAVIAENRYYMQMVAIIEDRNQRHLHNLQQQVQQQRQRQRQKVIPPHGFSIH
jgi:hypothetical protein